MYQNLAGSRLSDKADICSCPMNCKSPNLRQSKATKNDMTQPRRRVGLVDLEDDWRSAMYVDLVHGFHLFP